MFRGVSPLLQSMAVSQAKTLNVNIFCWLYNHVSETIRHVAKQVLQHLRMMDKMPYICKQLDPSNVIIHLSCFKEMRWSELKEQLNETKILWVTVIPYYLELNKLINTMQRL